MRKIILILFFFLSTNIFSQKKISNIIVLPYPQKIEMTNGIFRLDKNFTLKYPKFNIRLKKLTERLLIRLTKQTGLFLKNQIPIENSNNFKSTMVIKVDRIGKIKLNENEEYTLTVNKTGVVLDSKTDIGAIRGIETLLQLLQSDEKGYFFPFVYIHDSPRFPWRGLLIDVCRHFMPVNVLKRNLDGMAAAKMNVFHWHLSEDQGFRVECKTFPKLHELGSNGDYYTHEQIKDIINYASDRGIRVVPEFDIPGHATSWLVAYPELASSIPPKTVEKNYGIFDPTFNPAIEETYQFFDRFFAEMSKLFPDEYMHIGGDENNGKQWDANESIQQYMKANNIKDNHELQAYFNKRILKILTKYNKKMIGWDEILHKDIPKNIVIQSWRGKEALVKAAKKGYRGLLSNGYYIDLMQPTEYHYLNDPIIENANLTKEEEKNILGGEATMWSEWVTEENIDSRIWPRTAAIAERLWSSANINNIDDMFVRLNKFSLLIEEFGLTHITYQPKMLRRLANSKDIKTLEVLVNVVEPLQGYKRASDARKQGMEFSRYTPFTRVIDVANVDTKTFLSFNRLVDRYIETKNIETLKKIEKYLKLWSENHKKLLKIINKSPILFEIKPLSKNLEKLAKKSLEGLSNNYINKSQTSFIIQLEKVIAESRVSYGQVELVIIDAIEKLFGISNKD